MRAWEERSKKDPLLSSICFSSGTPDGTFDGALDGALDGTLDVDETPDGAFDRTLHSWHN